MSSEQETKTNEINKTRNNMTDFLIHPSFLSIDIIDSTPPQKIWRRDQMIYHPVVPNKIASGVTLSILPDFLLVVKRK